MDATGPLAAAGSAIDNGSIGLQPGQVIPGFDELVDVYGYGSIGGGSVFGSTNQVSWDVFRFDYRTEVTTDQSTVTIEGVESFVVDGSLYEVLDGTLSEVTDFMDPMISSNSSNQKIFDLDIWSYWLSNWRVMGPI